MIKCYAIFSLLLLLLSSGCRSLEPAANAQTNDVADSSEVFLTQVVVTDLVDSYSGVVVYQVEIDAPEQVNIGYGYDDLSHPLTQLENDTKILFVYETGPNTLRRLTEDDLGQRGIVEQMFVSRGETTKAFYRIPELETDNDANILDYLDDPIEPGEYWLRPYDILIIDGSPDTDIFIMPLPKR